MKGDRRRVGDLTRAVAQRDKVAWDDAMGSAENESERAMIAQLETVARIIEAHWGLPGNIKTLGDFELVEEIGRGGMGVVYKARQLSLDRCVAIKVLSWDIVSSEASIARFEREARALAALDHPNIVGVHSVEQTDDLRFISMELIEGQPLSSSIPRHGMRIEELLEIGFAIADALSFAHEHQVIHRDLKPANIMINEQGRPKILDFGLARLRRENRISSDARTLTATFDNTNEGLLLGTVPYMSPEQAKGLELDHRTDIFSLGVILYEMATGRRPFEGASPAAVISSITKGCVVPASTIRSALPKDLDRIIFHCLRKEPDQRYQTAKGLRNELQELAHVRELREFQPDLVKRPRARSGKKLAVYAVLSLILAFLAIKIPGLWPPQHPNYVAVLPFDVYGQQDESMTALSAGLAEVLREKLSRLTRTQDLQIASSVSKRGYPSLTDRGIGASLGVDLLVVGTLKVSGDDVHVVVNLIDENNDRRSQARAFDVPATDPLALQDEVVSAVRSMLKLELDSREEATLRSKGTTIGASHRRYLQGVGFLTNSDRIENLTKSIRSLETAIEEDPEYAEAHARLGRAYWKRYQHDDDARWLSRGLAACKTALELGEDLPEGHLCLGEIHLGTNLEEEAVAHFGWAMSQDPTSDESYRGLARAFREMGNPSAAEEIYRKATRERPRYWAGYAWLGSFYSSVRRYGESEEMFRKVVELTPSSHRAHADLGWALLAQNRFEDALPILERSLELGMNARAYGGLGRAYLGLGRYAEAISALEEAIGMEPDERDLSGNLAETRHQADHRSEVLAAYWRARRFIQDFPAIFPQDPWMQFDDRFGRRNAMRQCSVPR